QRPIAVHGLENLTRCDKGVAMLRQLLKRAIGGLQNGEDPGVSPLRIEGRIPTYCHDTVVKAPIAPGATEAQDLDAVQAIGAAITGIVVRGDHHTAPDRQDKVRHLIREYRSSHESHPSRQS
ncbi:MAG TPA: aromatic ring-hydroxylating dioxygenase subunit alpha, partial [Burkholderiales bacterium]|nr:aromatic ring-hydroxylating dioxygenase subunit alpha [Burkholderiales bacterium]